VLACPCFLGWPLVGSPRSANEVLVFFDDASVLDERQVMRPSRRFDLATPSPWRKPDSIRLFRDRLLDVSDQRIWPPEHHHMSTDPRKSSRLANVGSPDLLRPTSSMHIDEMIAY
jgi:hypothetical protein